MEGFTASTAPLDKFNSLLVATQLAHFSTCSISSYLQARFTGKKRWKLICVIPNDSDPSVSKYSSVRGISRIDFTPAHTTIILLRPSSSNQHLRQVVPSVDPTYSTSHKHIDMAECVRYGQRSSHCGCPMLGFGNN